MIVLISEMRAMGCDCFFHGVVEVSLFFVLTISHDFFLSKS